VVQNNYNEEEQKKEGYSSSSSAVVEVTFVNCSFINNDLSHSVVQLSSSGDRLTAIFHNCDFSNNVGVSIETLIADWEAFNTTTLVVSQCRFINNSNSAIHMNTKIRRFYIVVENTQFESNQHTALNVSTIDVENPPSILISNCEFTGNIASESGGALEISTNSGDVQITNCSFVNNKADVFGGAVAITLVGGNVTVTKSSFYHNAAGVYGGGLSIINTNSLATTLIHDSVFGQNTASDQNVGSGGAIWCTAGDDNQMQLVLDNVSFLNNSASETGGGLYVTGGGIQAIVANSRFQGNEAMKGGAIAASNVSSTSSSNSLVLKVTQSSFESNQAWSYGGSIFIDQGPQLYLDHSLFFKSSAGAGGAVFLTRRSESTIQFVTFENCSSPIDDETGPLGGALFVQV